MTKSNDFYLFFLSLFITSLVVSNLIFQKFFHLNFFGINFELSVGIIFYPVTFLVTDVVSEIFGKQKANKMVITGIYASIFCLVIIILLCFGGAIEWNKFGQLFLHGFTFKIIIAIIDTPLIYIVVFYLRKKFKLKIDQELK